MPKITTKMNEDMFQNLQIIAELQIKLSALSCDFEAAVIKTVQKLFPSTKIQVNIFHIYQSVQRLLVKVFKKTFQEKKELKKFLDIIKECSFFDRTEYSAMLDIQNNEEQETCFSIIRPKKENFPTY